MGAPRSRVGVLFATCAALAVACNALVGVEDVRLVSGLDAGGDDAASDALEPPPGDGGADADDGPQIQLALGYNHTCARDPDGRVRCWGSNGAGEIGNGVPLDGGTRAPVLVPTDVLGVTDAVWLASGLSHSCVVHGDGTASCWGYNFFGQLGDGTTTRSSRAVSVKGITTATSIAAGTSFTCALLEDRTAQCWGANYAGQLGDGTKDDRPTPAPVSGLSGATSLALAERHACAIVEGGTLVCWGGNDDGQLGNGTTAESLTPTPVPSLSNVVQVAAAAGFTCALERSGEVYCWGANTHGELGTGSTNDTPNPSPALTAVSGAVSIWVGYQHGCAALGAGGVVCWGAAGDGQVGSGSVPADASIPSPTPVVGVAGALSVGTGGAHSCATTRDGRIYCWGTNTLGQLGNGTKERAYAAVPVTGYPD